MLAATQDMMNLFFILVLNLIVTVYCLVDYRPRGYVEESVVAREIVCCLNLECIASNTNRDTKRKPSFMIKRFYDYV